MSDLLATCVCYFPRRRGMLRSASTYVTCPHRARASKTLPTPLTLFGCFGGECNGEIVHQCQNHACGLWLHVDDARTSSGCSRFVCHFVHPIVRHCVHLMQFDQLTRSIPVSTKLIESRNPTHVVRFGLSSECGKLASKQEGTLLFRQKFTLL